MLQSVLKPVPPVPYQKLRPGFLTTSFLHLAVLTLYFLAAAAVTWPLITRLSTQTAGNFPIDRDQNLWYLWWVRQALTVYHVNPYWTNFIYYPQGTSLYLFPSDLTGGILSLPFQSLFGLAAAFNLLYFAGIVGGAWGVFCLCRFLVRDNRAAFLAGLVYAFSPWKRQATGLNQLNISQIEWLPFLALWFIKFLDSLTSPDPALNSFKFRLRYGLLTALFLIFTAFTDQYHLVYASFLILALTGFYLFRLPGKANFSIPDNSGAGKKAKGRAAALLLGNVGLVLLPAAALYFPVALAALRDSNSGYYQETEKNVLQGADVLNLLFPWSDFMWGAVPVKPYASFSPGWWLVLALGIYGVVKIKLAKFWGAVFAAAWVLALGSNLVVNGNLTSIPLPAAIFLHLPGLSSMNYSARWLIPASLALAVCLAFGVAALPRQHLLARFIKVKSLNSGPLASLSGLLLTAVLFGFEFQNRPLPLEGRAVDVVSPVYYSGLLTQPGALLELPLVERNREKHNNMLYQTVHGRPIVEGYLARAPKADPYLNLPFAFFTEENSFFLSDIANPTASGLNSFLSYNNFAYLVLYRKDLTADRLPRFQQMIELVDGPLNENCIYDDTLTLVCPLKHPAVLEPLVVLGEGWYGRELDQDGTPHRWLKGREGNLGIFVPEARTYRFSFDAAAFQIARSLQIEIDGTPAANLTVEIPTKNYTVNLRLSAGNHTLRFYAPEPPGKPSRNGNSKDDRLLSLFFGRLQLQP